MHTRTAHLRAVGVERLRRSGRAESCGIMQLNKAVRALLPRWTCAARAQGARCRARRWRDAAPVSGFSSSSRGELRVQLVPMFTDNYSYLCWREGSADAFVVDPAEPSAVRAAAAEHQVTLSAVLTTHKHADHAGGNEELAADIDSLHVVGPKAEADHIPCINRAVEHDEQFDAAGVTLTALSTPCHTRGHAMYFVPESESGGAPVLFSGDTLFVGGCGRFFEGDAADMHAALDIVRALPPSTRLYCGHEYTLSNLMFAATLEAGNAALLSKLRRVVQARNEGRPTVPSTLEEEMETNVFLRCAEPSVAAAVGLAGASPVEVLAEVRRRKDEFKGKC